MCQGLPLIEDSFELQARASRWLPCAGSLSPRYFSVEGAPDSDRRSGIVNELYMRSRVAKASSDWGATLGRGLLCLVEDDQGADFVG